MICKLDKLLSDLECASSINIANRKVIQVSGLQSSELMCEYVTAAIPSLMPAADVQLLYQSDEPGKLLLLLIMLVDETEVANKILDANLQPSTFKKYCPVEYYDKKVLLPGLSQYSASYKGFVFFFANKDSLLKFRGNPRPFLALKPINRKPSLFVMQPKSEYQQQLLEQLSIDLGNASCTVLEYNKNGVAKVELAGCQKYLIVSDSENHEHASVIVFVTFSDSGMHQ